MTCAIGYKYKRTPYIIQTYPLKMKARLFFLLISLWLCMSAFSQKNIPTDNLYRVISVRKHCKNEYIIIAAKNKKLYYIIRRALKKVAFFSALHVCHGYLFIILIEQTLDFAHRCAILHTF